MEISETDVKTMDCGSLRAYVFALSQVENSFSSVVATTDAVLEAYEKAKSDVRTAIADLSSQASSLMEEKVCLIEQNPEPTEDS